MSWKMYYQGITKYDLSSLMALWQRIMKKIQQKSLKNYKEQPVINYYKMQTIRIIHSLGTQE